MDEVTAGRFAPADRAPGSRDYSLIVNWNIERGQQLPGILDFLRTAEADLILLQEVDLNVRRTGYLDIGRELARSLRLNYVFGAEFQELGRGSESSPALHGMATLSPWPLSNGRILRFQRQSNFWKPRWYVPQAEIFQRRLGGRIALVAEALVYGRKLVSYNLHLESKGDEVLRLQQLREALEDSRQHTASSTVVLAGDLNLNVGNGAAAAMLNGRGFHDAVRLPDRPTTAARRPFQRERPIDWIYVSGEAGSEGRVHDNVRASDHYPLSAKLRRKATVLWEP